VLAIMQISMRGRIAEIGLRKAVGARPRDLQAQIVLEVAIVAVAASLVGVILARIGITIAAPMLLAKMGIEALSMSTSAVLIAVAASIVTGIAGGVFPARRAARLDPVAALR
jgi:putative ABC transport system permease protein